MIRTRGGSGYGGVIAGSLLILLALLAAHDFSHAFDEGLETSLGQLALVAVPQWVALLGLTAVVLRGDRVKGAVGALLLGAGAAVGLTAVHLLPVSSAAYWELDPSPVSWLLAWAPLAVALVLVFLAASELRRKPLATRA